MSVQSQTQPQEETKTEEQPELIKEIEGKCGTIAVMKPSRPIKKTDADLHTLIARVLLMKEKRLAEATG
ncbi:hypothetical protein [Bacillus coahuilensis]|uniref:hypothetical protein n=1 Tax=Bacillus coahuilensis TaxID=408580 RepID=UPI0002D6F598|nr:hypothetical protein [Bacillus coahuilensis]